MAERKAVNKYYPPDWDPRKSGSVNKRVGQHPLRDRAKKLGQGILVIRFELPYNIWCGGCGSHVGMGVRYNAEKSKVGNYYSTPIYKFRMKCHLCDNYFEIQTDPQNHDYVILSGARRKEQRWDPHENEQIVPEDKATQKKMATDAMYKLEHGSDDKQKGSDKVASLAQLEESRISMIDDYILNRMARDKFRAEKKVLTEAAEADRAILEKAALSIELVEETEEDRKLAGLLKYTATSSFEDKQKEKRKNIEMRPLFESSGPSKVTQPSNSSSTSVLPFQRHVAPNLSRRGEIKQKLGWALKASYKDPFKVTKVKNKQSGVGIQSTHGSLVSSLGIRLKSPGSSKPIDEGKSCTKNLEQPNGSSQTLSVTKGENKNACVYDNDISQPVISNEHSTNGDNTQQVDATSSSDSSSNIDSSCKINKEEDIEALESSYVNPSEKGSPFSGSALDQCKVFCTSEEKDVMRDSQGDVSLVLSPDKQNNSGLSALMSSYTDLDSGTDSS